MIEGMTCRKCGENSDLSEWNEATEKSFGKGIVTMEGFVEFSDEESMSFICPVCGAEHDIEIKVAE